MKDANEYILIMATYLLFLVGFDTRGANKSYALLGIVIVCLGGILKVLLTEAFGEQKITKVTSLIFFSVWNSNNVVRFTALVP